MRRRAAAEATQRPYGRSSDGALAPVERAEYCVDDRVRLAAAAMICSRQWAKVRLLLGRVHPFVGKDSEALRSQWRRDRKDASIQSAAKAMVERGDLVKESAGPQHGGPPQQQSATGRKRRRPRAWSSESDDDEEEEAEAATCCGLAGAPEAFIALQPFDVSRRMICTGRGWSRAVVSAVEPARELTRRAQECVELWQLGTCAPGRSMMACQVPRARARVGEYIKKEQLRLTVKELKLTVAKRDELKLVFYPGDVLPAFLGAHDNVLILSGPAIGAPRFIMAEEVARLMGHPVGPTSPFGIASRLMREQQLYELICDSLHTLFGAQLVRDGWQRAGWWGNAVHVRYGSLMGSGLDGFFGPVKSACGTVEYVLQADFDSRRAAVLLAAHGVAASYSSAAAAARDFRGDLDVLSMTAPCKLLSQKRRVSPEEAAELERRAEAETRAAWEAFADIVRRCRPRVVMMEQVASLQSHNRGLYTWFNARLAELPYVFAHGVVDAASDLHAVHSRRRLGWVGVAEGG